MISLLALVSASWLGVTLSEPYADVFTRIGDPVVATHDATLNKFVYLTDHGNAFVTVVTERGRVSAIRLWALPTATPQTVDPFGIALNADASAVLQKRGSPTRAATDADGPFDAYQNGDVLWLYHVNANKTVSTITLSTTEAAIRDLPEQPLPALHDGTSPAQAVRMDVSSSGDAARWESMFLAVHPCNGGGKLHEDSRSTQTQDGRAYDVIKASCSSGGTTTALYFTRA
jgi:hypothetical protein